MDIKVTQNDIQTHIRPFFKFYFWHFCLFLLQQDRVELTGSEVGEREGGGFGKGPQVRNQTQDAWSAMCLRAAHKAISADTLDPFNVK